ncbi:unnamed protein product, partial [Brassica oleracea var. botrytis]
EPSSSLVHRARSFPQYPFHPPLLASAVFPLHLPESAARSSPSVASAGREDLGKALRDWNLWGPFFFIVFLGLTLSWSASVKKVIKILASKLKFTIKCYKKWGEMARKICLDDVEVKLGELEAEIFVIKAINDNLGHIESGRDPENYLKYSVQDIERIVLDFFEEYTHVTPAKLEKTMKEEDWRGYFLSFVLFWFPSHVSML